MDIGAFNSKETILQCPQCQTIFFSEKLRALVPEQCKFGFDIINYVGRSIFTHCRNEQEIVNELAARNISISGREVSYLGKKFITYLALAHRESYEQLRKAMTLRGGYILHVDGTCEGDSPNLFTGIDGISELVLHNIKIPSEKKDRLIPFFRQVKKLYGVPRALVHDMGKAILAAIAIVFPNVLDFICHFHFLRDIGKDLFRKEYQVIRNCLKKHGIRTQLRQKLRALSKIIEQGPQAIQDLKESIEKGHLKIASVEQLPAISTYAMIHWAFDVAQQSAGYGFPFDYPHLIFLQRLRVVHSVLVQIKDIHLRHKVRDNRPFYQLWRILDEVIKDKELNSSVALMEEKTTVFNKLRQALRIALPEGNDGLNDEGGDADMKTIEKAVEDFREQVITDTTLLAKDDYKKMIAQINEYWEKLFAAPITVNTPNGPVTIVPQRTNNLLERFFRNLKRAARKRSGTSSLSKTLKAILADTPFVRNLENEEYLQIILGDCETLEKRFSQIDAKLVREHLKKAQESLDSIPSEIKEVIKQKNLPELVNALFAA
ncbi:MAG: transposase [Gammaproteobacteria bacterium]|nr:transposase [Gammaproteobacteria bacterium]